MTPDVGNLNHLTSGEGNHSDKIHFLDPAKKKQSGCIASTDLQMKLVIFNRKEWDLSVDTIS